MTIDASSAKFQRAVALIVISKLAKTSSMSDVPSKRDSFYPTKRRNSKS